jgi:hypothetical protein
VIVLAAFVIVIVCTLTAAVVLRRHQPAQQLTLGIPAYGYPTMGTMWSRFATLPPSAIVVHNPASGPGEQVDVVYQLALGVVRARNVTVYGYIDTAYGTRSLDAIEEEARRFEELYQPDGIFLDQTPPHRDGFGFVRAAVLHLRALGFEVALNPGQPDIDPDYAELGDHVVNFEGRYDDYVDASFPDWLDETDAEHFWHLVYDAPDEAALDRVMQLARERHAGVLFVTDARMPNPWDRLPPYWPAQVRKLS